jgi:pre-60S factor REI1
MPQVDSNACKMVYDDNEEEYEDFYDYTALDGEDDAEGA